MKKANQLVALMLTGAVLLSSCGKDDEASVKPQAEFPTAFSEKTVAENKEQLETNGIELINNIAVLKDSKGVEASIAFSSFSNRGTMPASNQRVLKTNKAVELLHVLASFGRGATSAQTVMSGLRTTDQNSYESIQQFFDEYKGTYSFNHTSGDWDKSAADKIVFQFPSTEGGTKNNAAYTIYDYKGIKSTNVALDGYAGDVPTSLKADLTVDGANVLSYSFAASYNSNGDPASVSTSLTSGDFKMAVDLANSVSDVRADYTLTRGGKNLLSFGSNGKGAFNSKVNKDADSVSAVLTYGNAYFQIMNIKFSSEAKVTELEAAINKAETEEEIASAMNSHSKLIVYYADSKKKIADSEFYSKTETHEYESCSYDSNRDLICTTQSYTSTNTDVRLIFADKTKSDLATYTEVGFEDIQKEFENQFGDM